MAEHANVSAILVGTFSRLIAHFVTPAEWAGADTLVPPLLSLITFLTVMKMTSRVEAPQPLAVHGD